MTQHAERIDKTTVRFERLLPGPIERVWSYITVSDKRRLWLAGGNFELTVGGPIELHFENTKLSPLPDDSPPRKYRELPKKMDYVGTITRCEPPSLLTHTWVDGDMESEVEYRLAAEGDQVRLIITHRKLTDEDTILGVMGGWHAHTDILEDVLLGRTPRPFWKTHTALEAEYKSRLQH